jgi:hypothetical protein
MGFPISFNSNAIALVQYMNTTFRLWILLSLLFLGVNAFGGDVYLDKNGVSTKVSVLGFSAQADFSKRQSYILNLTADHYVFLIDRSLPAGDVIVFQLKTFTPPIQAILAVYNQNKIDIFNDAQASGFAQRLLTIASNQSVDVAVTTFRAETNTDLKNSAIVRYTMAILETSNNESSITNTKFASVNNTSPLFWPAWRANVYRKLKEVNLLAAALVLNNFHREIKQYMDTKEHLGRPFDDPKVYAELIWILDVAEVMSSDNPAAEKIVESILSDDVSRDRLKRYEEQLEANSFQLKEELAERAAANRARIEALVAAARMEYNTVGKVLNDQWIATKAVYDLKYPKYAQYMAVVSRERNNLSNAQSSRNSAQFSVNSAERDVDNYSDKLEDADTQSEIDSAATSLRSARTRLNDAVKRLAIAEAQVAALQASLEAAEDIAEDYYSTEIHPIILQLQDINKRIILFMANFRKTHSEAIPHIPELIQQFARWDQWIEQLRLQQLGRRVFLGQKRKNTKLAEKAKKREEALAAAALVDYDVNSELQLLVDLLQASADELTSN